ncbi:MAG TPA: PIN domain-containing protein [Candidatus Saccharimonadales bacterium]|uniref:Ribonuclease VapC n=1 Tax=Candidatus Giovannonibacteria bacterium GW2011_GWC2_44_8 TaxID=1618657 RepID=A0A0G1K2X5_9BACT|nr:MAG: hypothetical protein UW74_C0029G0007 [Candidatus Giovannonibacteria bacterium GW2011_GWC2_44_8]HLA49387.1 PIN domain-containing protein [Candidatus Saccharimonadales bacterium]
MATRADVFVDSNFLIALYNRSDSLHGRAAKIANQLDRDRSQLYISNYVLLEVLTVLSQRVGRATAISAGQSILSEPQIAKIHIDEGLNTLSWRTFRNIKAKNVGFVDCSILAVMGESGIKQLLTFDSSDFGPLCKEFGFSLIGS